MSTEQNRRKLEGSGSEERLRAIQARFRAITPKRSWLDFRKAHVWLLPALVGAGLGMIAYLLIDLF
ncbi:MAG TPA: hypothetical protein PKY87_01975 [Terricaulis sp.]|nr:hypothetical protein [Terricaulis sp.]